jgi:hypothetical protein
MIPGIVKLCESPSKAGGLLMINYWSNLQTEESNISVRFRSKGLQTRYLADSIILVIYFG